MAGRLAWIGCLVCLFGLAIGGPSPAAAADAKAVRARLEALEEEAGDLLGALDALERQAAEEAAALKAAEAQIEATRGELDRLEAERARTRRALAERVEALKPRLVARYRLGEAGYLPFLLGAGDAGEMMRRRRLLDRVVREDLDRLAEVRRLQEALAEQEAGLERRRAALDGLRASAASRLQAVERARGERRAALETLRHEQSLQKRALAALEAAGRRLGGMVRGLAPGGARGFAALKGRLPLPATGAIDRGFGRTVDPAYDTVTFHKGVDIRAPAGAKVRAVAAGRVVHAGWLRGYGNLVILDHGGGYHSLMAHLATMEVEVGQDVAAGRTLGRVGDTGSLKGAFLYFEIREHGRAVDPAPWFAR